MARVSIKFSDLSSVSFNDDWRGSVCNYQRTHYAPKFLPSDQIKVQYAVGAGASITSIVLYDKCAGQDVDLFGYRRLLYANSDASVYDLVFGGMPAGDYELRFCSGSAIIAAAPLSIRDSLPYSVLIQYNNRENDFGTIFTPYSPFFTRIEGEFRPEDDEYSVEDNNFRDQNYTLRHLSASPTTVRKLSFGGDWGAPNFIGNKVNRIFACSDVLIDGERYVRADGVGVTKEVWSADYPKYPFKIDVEKTESGFFEVAYDDGTTVSCALADFVNIFEWVDANVVRTSVWRNAADMIDVLPSNRVRTGDWQNAADMIDDVPVNRMRTGNWSGLADMIDVWERNTECTWMDFVKILNYRVTTWQNADDMIDVLPVNQSRTGDWQNAADMVDVLPVNEVRTGDWSGAADMVDVYPDPPRESYWVDTGGVRHDFALSNTPISAFATSNGYFTINGAFVYVSQIVELHFGEDYDTAKSAGQFFLYDLGNLSRLTMPRNLSAAGTYMGGGSYNLTYIDCGQINASLSTISSSGAWLGMPNVATSIRKHAMQALADAWGVRFPRFSNWSVLIG